jgi:hypothetical protein
MIIIIILRVNVPFVVNVTYHRFSNKNNTMGGTSGAGTGYPIGSPEFIPLFNGVHITKSMVFCVVFCRSLCVLLSFAHCILVVLRLTASNYPFGIFKLFFEKLCSV